jgi:DNA-binding MarR family transcriptional regulator
VASLVAAGRVTRETHGDDRRRSVLELSEEGYRVYAEVAPAAIAYERRLLACLSADDQLALSRLLEQLSAAEEKTN